MQWKKGNPRRMALALALILAGVVLCILPYTFWVTGLLLTGLGAAVLVLPLLTSETLRNALWLAIGIGFVLLESCMGLIRVYGEPDPTADTRQVAVVLGAQVNGTAPSRTLRLRLDEALEYLQAAPEATVFVSGGKGGGENIAEAEAMYAYLQSHGADMTRVIREPESSTTLENLRNCAALAKEQGLAFDKITIITSEFHAARAQFIAGRLGIDAVCRTAQTRPLFFRLNYYIREVPAFLKALLLTA